MGYHGCKRLPENEGYCRRGLKRCRGNHCKVIHGFGVTAVGEEIRVRKPFIKFNIAFGPKWHFSVTLLTFRKKGFARVTERCTDPL